MIRIASIVAGALALAGCNGDASRAERAFEIADKAGNGDDACRAAKDAAAAYLKAGSEDQYKQWSSRSTVVCYNADAARSRGVLRF